MQSVAAVNEKRNALLNLVGKSGRGTELLIDPATGSDSNWFMHVPRCFCDALDIKLTSRVVDGRKSNVWTQGSEYSFKPGDTLYDTPQMNQTWGEAIKHISVSLQIMEPS